MPNSPEFVDYVIDRLASLGSVGAKRMFGGHGIYLDGLMFALIASDTLYLKVDDGNRAAYEAEGMTPFKPFSDRPTTMSYYPLPEEVFEDQEAMAAWAREAFAAALRGRRGGSRKSKSAPR